VITESGSVCIAEVMGRKSALSDGVISIECRQTKFNSYSQISDNQ